MCRFRRGACGSTGKIGVPARLKPENGQRDDGALVKRQWHAVFRASRGGKVIKGSCRKSKSKAAEMETKESGRKKRSFERAMRVIDAGYLQTPFDTFSRSDGIPSRSGRGLPLRSIETPVEGCKSLQEDSSLVNNSKPPRSRIGSDTASDTQGCPSGRRAEASPFTRNTNNRSFHLLTLATRRLFCLLSFSSCSSAQGFRGRACETRTEWRSGSFRSAASRLRTKIGSPLSCL
jgi:hypothetical protein